MSKYRSSIIQFWTQNHAFDFAIIGGALGVSVGLLTTVKKRVMSAMIAGPLGLLLGGISGFSASRWAVHEFVMNSDQYLIRGILLNSIVWSVAPIAIWVAIGSIQGIRPLSILGVGGLLTGVFTSAIYLIAFVVAFPTADLSHLVCKSFLEKAVWCTLISTTLGIGLFLSLKRARLSWEATREVASK